MKTKMTFEQKQKFTAKLVDRLNAEPINSTKDFFEISKEVLEEVSPVVVVQSGMTVAECVAQGWTANEITLAMNEGSYQKYADEAGFQLDELSYEAGRFEFRRIK